MLINIKKVKENGLIDLLLLDHTYELTKDKNIEVHGIIYKIENKVNNKVYIGQTTRGFKTRYGAKGSGIERVYNYYEGRRIANEGYNVYFSNSIKKYGFDKFNVSEVIDVAFSQEELDSKEIMYIKKFRSSERNYGYNFTEGGNGGKKSKDCISRDGVMVMCINDGKTFKSKRKASDHYDVSIAYINKSSKRRFYSNFKNFDFLRFRVLRRELKEDEMLCKCCGRFVKLKPVKTRSRVICPKTYSKNAKYCSMCKTEKQRKLKKKDIEYDMKNFYKAKK